MRTSPTAFSSTSGVFPIRWRTLAATRVSATGHCRQQDHRRAGLHFGVEPVERADVLTPDVDVCEGQLLLQCREPAHQIVEQVTYGVALCHELALAADLLAQRRG